MPLYAFNGTWNKNLNRSRLGWFGELVRGAADLMDVQSALLEG
jgi:hypothetical protein